MKSIEKIIHEAIAGGIEKSAGDTPNVSEVLCSLEKTASSPRVDSDVALKLIKSAAAALRRAQDEIGEFQKIAHVRECVDEMLNDGLITQYEVKEAVASLMSSGNAANPVVGNLFTKVADAGSKPERRGMFDDIISV